MFSPVLYRLFDMLTVAQLAALIAEMESGIAGRMAASETMCEAIEAAIASHTNRITALETSQTTQDASLATLAANDAAIAAQIASLITQVAAKKSVITLPDVTITAAALITLTAGEKTFNALACAGLKTTDSVIVSVKTMAAGYGLRSWTQPADNQITIKMQCPVLSVGGSNIVLGVTGFR